MQAGSSRARRSWAGFTALAFAADSKRSIVVIEVIDVAERARGTHARLALLVAHLGHGDRQLVDGRLRKLFETSLRKKLVELLTQLHVFLTHVVNLEAVDGLSVHGIGDKVERLVDNERLGGTSHVRDGRQRRSELKEAPVERLSTGSLDGIVGSSALCAGALFVASTSGRALEDGGGGGLDVYLDGVGRLHIAQQ